MADRTIADRLDDLCERQPGQTLVVDGVRSLSAAKVRKLARRLGRVLAERGLRPGTLWAFSCRMARGRSHRGGVRLRGLHLQPHRADLS